MHFTMPLPPISPEYLAAEMDLSPRRPSAEQIEAEQRREKQHREAMLQQLHEEMGYVPPLLSR